MDNKTQWFPPSSFGVDAGNIAVLDGAFITENGGTLDSTDTTTINVRPGRYKVRLFVRGTYHGNRQRTRVVCVKGDKLIVGDACYSWSDVEQDKWQKFLDKTKYLDHMKEGKNNRGVVVDTGGDGVFPAEVVVERLGD